MKFERNIKYSICLIGIIVLATFLRFYCLMNSGFKFTDEGYHFFPSIDLYNASERGLTHFLQYYHALEIWICLGCSFLGFTYNGALLWAAICGTLTVPLLYLFCAKLFSKRTALFCALALAFNYYLVFYARTALATGYAIFFCCWFLLVFDRAMRFSGLFATPKNEDHSIIAKHLSIVAAGVFLGMLTHIRIELGFIGVGFVGALGLAVLISNGFNNIFERWRETVSAWIPLSVLLLYAVATYFLFFVLLDSFELVDWKNSMVFYKGHLGFAAGSEHTWKPYIITEIWHLSGGAFIIVALYGLISETFLFRRLDLRRKWCLISFWGLTIFLFKTGLPYPRTYVYTILVMCVYWGLGVRRIAALLPRKRRFQVVRVCVVVFIVLATFACELRLIKTLFHKKSRYDEAERFIAERGPGNIHVTHSWPIFELLPFKYKRYVVYDTYGRYSTYKSFCKALKGACYKQNVNYMILDNNLTYWGNDIKMIQQFAATVLPDAVFQNDYGDDWHTCMDAFGKPPIRNMFTNRIMVYDMRNFAKIPREPIPFLGAKRMDQIFTERWARKCVKEHLNTPMRSNSSPLIDTDRR